jgi:hypothetical protein
VGIAEIVLINLGSEDFGIFRWCLAIVAVLLIGVVVASLLNFAVFAPVYWLLGRRQPKKIGNAIKLHPEP